MAGKTKKGKKEKEINKARKVIDNILKEKKIKKYLKKVNWKNPWQVGGLIILGIFGLWILTIIIKILIVLVLIFGFCYGGYMVYKSRRKENG